MKTELGRMKEIYTEEQDTFFRERGKTMYNVSLQDIWQWRNLWDTIPGGNGWTLEEWIEALEATTAYGKEEQS